MHVRACRDRSGRHQAHARPSNPGSVCTDVARSLDPGLQQRASAQASRGFMQILP